MVNVFYKRVASWRIWQLKEQTSIEQINIFAPKDTSFRSMILLRNKEKKVVNIKQKNHSVIYISHTFKRLSSGLSCSKSDKSQSRISSQPRARTRA